MPTIAPPFGVVVVVVVVVVTVRMDRVERIGRPAVNSSEASCRTDKEKPPIQADRGFGLKLLAMTYSHMA